MISLEDDFTGRLQQCKMNSKETLMEDDLRERHFKGRQPQRKMTSFDLNENGRQLK